ncbi:type II secretion system F family protein [Blastopirellula sp. JC732]|uniref:Type II secretion system F family protein n=1 Tax=Blastopirellula sediminis TaxID=2894196 RepID=A0A9X1SI79_9BACT|nr:type II secretion system F family protein [Blastopirellula sediminis]MCC9605427.1 type II secretion system F family protein [Blastopirellula sediminis]MCC9631273.1 type II secretion system F family protein [Blastopirellula sediminis]
MLDNLDPNIMALIIFAGVASIAAFIFFAVKELAYGGESGSSTSVGLRQFPPRRTSAEGSSLGEFDHWLTRTLYLSGADFGPTMAVTLLLAVGLVCGTAAFVLTEDPLVTGLAVVLGIFAGLGVLIWIKRRRLQAFQTQFPGALELIARAVRAGESFEQAVHLVGETSEDPIGIEFRRAAKQLDIGLSVPAAMEGMADRVELMDVKIFATTISVHRESGGALPETLDRLAAVIRDRMAYHRQLRSITSAGRMSATIISMLAPLLLLFFLLFQPEYFSEFFSHPWGRYLLLFAVISEALGLYFVYRLVKADY